MVSPKVSRSRPSADHILHSNSTADYFLGGTRRDWMCSSNSLPNRLPTEPASEPVVAPLASLPTNVAPVYPVTPGSPLQPLQQVKSMPLPNRQNPHAITPPSTESPESHPSPASANIEPNDSAATATTILAVPASAPSNTEQAYPVDRDRNPALSNQQPQQTQLPEKPSQSVNLRANNELTQAIPLAHPDVSTPGPPVSLPPERGQIVPDQQLEQHSSTGINGRTEPVPDPAGQPAHGVDQSSQAHTPTEESRMDWETCRAKCKNLEQLTQVANTLQMNSPLVGPRIMLLRDAITFEDRFYLVLHQLFCLRTQNQVNLITRLPIFRRAQTMEGMNRLQDLLESNERLPPDILSQLASFPDKLEVMMQSPWYVTEVQQIAQFLSNLAAIIPTLRLRFYQVISQRGYPYLMSEMAPVFQISTYVILSVIFNSTFRQIYAAPYLPELNRLLRHEMTLNQVPYMTPENKDRTLSQIIDGYTKISSSVRLANPSSPKPPSTPSTPQLNSSQLNGVVNPNGVATLHSNITFESPSRVTNAIPSVPNIARASKGTASKRGRRHARASTTSVQQTPSVQQASGFPPRRSQSVYFQWLGPNGIPQALQWQPDQGHMRPYYAGVASFAPPPPGHVWQFQPNLGGYMQDRRAASEIQPQSHQVLQQFPQLQTREQITDPPQVHQQASLQAPMAPPAQPQSLPRPFIPPHGYIVPQTANGNPMRIGLHQAYLRDPNKRVGIWADGAFTESELYYYLCGFKLTPTLIDPEKIEFAWNFEISPDEFARRPRSMQTGRGAPPTMTYQPGCYSFRLRSIALPLSLKDHAIQEWPARNTSWPSVFYVFANGAEMEPRRKVHNEKDLSLDLTQLLKEGTNELVVKILLGPPECQNFCYVFGVEVMEVSNFSRVRSLVQSISVDDSCQAIQKRLNANPDDDDDLAIVTDDISISLLDPFSAQIFQIPARSTKCSHLECFDLDTFIHTRKSVSGPAPMNDKWRCPICTSDARPQNLVIDYFLAEVRGVLERENRLQIAQSISYRIDGTWTVKTISEEQQSEKGPHPPKRKASHMTDSRSATPAGKEKSPPKHSELMVIELD